MRSKKIIAVVISVLMLSLTLFTSCGQGEPAKEIGPEVGVWKAEYKISDIDDSQLSEDDRLLLSMLAGNVMFEVTAEFCEDNTFTYEINTDAIEEAISESVSTITSFFFDFDVSLFTDRLVESAFQSVLESEKTEYMGSYTKDDNGLITAVDGDNLYFKVTSNRLVQTDGEGNTVLTFKASSSESE